VSISDSDLKRCELKFPAVANPIEPQYVGYDTVYLGTNEKGERVDYVGTTEDLEHGTLRWTYTHTSPGVWTISDIPDSCSREISSAYGGTNIFRKEKLCEIDAKSRDDLDKALNDLANE
jgi:hypothetical protein